MFMLALALATAQASSPTASAKLQAAIKSYWSTELKDASSARWLWPKQKSALLYCGWVNAKNSFGGYAGWTPYVVDLDGTRVKDGFFLPGNPSAARAMGAACVSAGYDVENPPK